MSKLKLPFPQVNYFKDHTKLIVGGERQFIVTYINSERQSRSWSLPDLARRGALPQVGTLQDVDDGPAGHDHDDQLAKRDMLAGHNIEIFKTTRCDFSL